MEATQPKAKELATNPCLPSLFDDCDIPTVEVHKRKRKFKGQVPKKVVESEIDLFASLTPEEKQETKVEIRETIETMGLVQFLKESDRYKVMTTEEEQAIFKEYKATKSIETRNRIICSNIKLLVLVAKKIAKNNNRVPLEDMINDGVFGLIKAIEKFDLSRGNKFSTYAYQWIRQTITRSIANTGDTIRLPVHFTDNMVKINRFENQYKQEHECNEVPDEITAEALNIPLDKVKKFKGAVRVTSSIDTEIGDKPVTYKDIILDENGLSPEEQFINNQWSEMFLEIVRETLQPREIFIIMHRFELNGAEKMTSEKLAKKMGLTSERVRQIELEALNKLKEPMSEIIEAN